MKWLKERETFGEYMKRFVKEFQQEETYVVWGTGNNCEILSDIFWGGGKYIVFC